MPSNPIPTTPTTGRPLCTGRLADLARFEHHEAASKGLRLGADWDEITGERTWIATNDNGGQFITIESHYSNGGLFMVEPVRGRYHISRLPFEREDDEATSGSLEDALQAVLRRA